MSQPKGRIDSQAPKGAGIQLGQEASIRVLRTVLVGLLIAAIDAEGVQLLFGILPGVIFHSALFVFSITLYLLITSFPYRQAVLAVALLPLLRILSLAMPLAQLPQVYWYALTGVPLLVAAFLVYRMMRLQVSFLLLHWQSLASEVILGLTGIPLGITGYLILRPALQISGSSFSSLAIDVLILVVFAGFLEEFIFRGLILHSVTPVLGGWGVFFSALAYAGMFLGSQSLLYVLLSGIVGLIFNSWVLRSRTIWGVTLAHSLWYIGMLLIWPAVLH